MGPLKFSKLTSYNLQALKTFYKQHNNLQITSLQTSNV